MIERKFQIRFTTPAFLGNAEQNGQWRTPPFKALLRQWWRVVWATDHGFQVGAAAQATMRREEGLLFGHAWLENDRNEQGDTIAARKSLVRIRLDRWARPNIGNLPGIGMVCHPEVNRPGLQNCAGGAPGKLVDAGQYLGYGPFQKPNAAIQAGEMAKLAIAFPEIHAPRLERALWLMDRYGTLGGRCRNGWGSFSLLPLPSGEGRGEGKPLAGSTPLRFWQDCLNLDWPHAIGQDERGALIWQTQPFDDWKALMRRLAEIKIGLRRLFLFPNERPDGEVHDRHWLSYPVTKHNVREWDRNKLRLPNTLRFKVRATPEGKLVGVIFHVPHLPPAAFNPNPSRAAIERTWKRVHELLDHLKNGSPRTYPMIPEVAPVNRRSALKPHLDTITLTRILE